MSGTKHNFIQTQCFKNKKVQQSFCTITWNKCEYTHLDFQSGTTAKEFWTDVERSSLTLHINTEVSGGLAAPSPFCAYFLGTVQQELQMSHTRRLTSSVLLSTFCTSTR